MLGLWTGSPEAIATKSALFFGVLGFGLVLISVAVPYLLLRKRTPSARLVVGSYLAGFAATFGVIVAALWYLGEIEKMPPLIANRAFGNVPVAVIGPAAGIWIAAIARRRRKPTSVTS